MRAVVSSPLRPGRTARSPADTLAAAQSSRATPRSSRRNSLRCWTPSIRSAGQDAAADALHAVSHFAPSAWVLPLKFTGGGLSAPGKIMFDARAMRGPESTLSSDRKRQTILGRQSVGVRAERKPLSPVTTGFQGGGVEGPGFGTAVMPMATCGSLAPGARRSRFSTRTANRCRHPMATTSVVS